MYQTALAQEEDALTLCNHGDALMQLAEVLNKAISHLAYLLTCESFSQFVAAVSIDCAIEM